MSKTEEKTEEKQQQRMVGQYIIKETLGKGGYSWVKKGVHSKTGDKVALKFMTRAGKSWEAEQADQVKTEIKSMIRIKSPNVMKLYAYNLNCQYPTKDGNPLRTILLVLELCPGGELFDILYYTQQLDPVTARTYFVQMIKGLEECHNAGIVHRDIKPQNLLMDARYQLKITDFGLSKLCKNKDADTAVMRTHYVGTRGYQAPEILKKKKYGKACDIFSAGVVLFILLTGYPPFEQAVKSDKWYQPLAFSDPKLFWSKHKGCGVEEDAMELITEMLQYHANNRITIEKILESKFATGKTHSPDELYKVLKKKHRQASSLRKKDKKKMKEMQDSVKKKRGKDLLEETAKQLSTGVQCPLKEIEARETFLTKRWVVCPKYKEQNASEIEQKEETGSVPMELIEAYITTKIALECNGKSEILNVKANNPWNLICTVTDINENKYRIHLTIDKDENGVYYFNFERVSGDILKFHKLWEKIEIYFLHSPYMTDEMVQEADEEEESEEMKTQHADNVKAVKMNLEKSNSWDEDEQKKSDNETGIQKDLQRVSSLKEDNQKQEKLEEDGK